MNKKWDMEADVVVVGYGLAGATAAVAAHDAGASVLLMEKLGVAGGNSILAGGGFIYSTDVKEAFKYLKACSGDRVDEDVINFMARGLVEFPSYLNQFAEAVGATIEFLDAPHLFYPFPGRDSFRALKVSSLAGKERLEAQVKSMFTMDDRGVGTQERGGRTIMGMMFRNIERRSIKTMLSTPAKRLVQDPQGRVVGLVAESTGSKIAIKARKGVILACGGFEFNDWLKKQYCEIQPVYGVGCPGNTGDGILMSQKAGAALWHMWHLHGSYGFKFPECRQAFRLPLAGAYNPKQPAKLCWILVNKDGKRFMNEAIPFLQDSGYRWMQSMNTDFYNTRTRLPEYTHIPCYLILDDEGIKQGPIANPMALLEEDEYRWSEDNKLEIEKGWITQADTIRELAERNGIDPSELESTVSRWNSHCKNGEDSDFLRNPGSMAPIVTPPYYAVQCWPIVTNTQGGPQFNSKCQIVDPYGEPIRGLYKAGELGSFYGHLYILGGNLSECVIEGKTAGENAAAELP